MLVTISYNRERAVAYARKWALDRNPAFFDFTGVGGNCTNFVSQCIFAGCGIMNFTKTFGWYYLSPDDRAPAWSGVDEIYDFLIGAPDFISANGGVGPFATDASVSRKIEIGDVIQLSNENGEFYHSLLICGFTDNDILVCANSDNALDRPLSTYNFSGIRILHIEGAKVETEDTLSPPNTPEV